MGSLFWSLLPSVWSLFWSCPLTNYCGWDPSDFLPLVPPRHQCRSAFAPSARLDVYSSPMCAPSHYSSWSWHFGRCSLETWGFSSPHPLESSLKPILTWIKKKKLPFVFIHPSMDPSVTLIHRLFALEMLLRDWSPTDMSRYPHSGFISTVCSSRSLRLQFCTGTVPLCQSPTGNACQHRWKWRRRGEYLNYVLGGDWDTP